ncbi:translation factor GTPase family protein [Bacillus sp. FSL W7-1321]
MKTINIGVLAHVDAGKTTLTEQMLYQAGVIKEAGSVDKGNTTTDTLAIERERGITVKAAAVSFFWNDVKVNIIDTPGHADFISEVEHALTILDGAILIVSAVKGVQAQTRVLMQSLKAYRIPTVFFINKIDRVGADYKRVIKQIKWLLDDHICPMCEQTQGDTAYSIKATCPQTAGWLDVLALHNDELLAAYVENEPVSEMELRKELSQQTKKAVAYPLFIGSAAKGVGVSALLHSLSHWFSHTTEEASERDLSGIVFKVTELPNGEREALVRLYEGRLVARKMVSVSRADHPSFSVKVKHLQQLENGGRTGASAVSAGDVAVLREKSLQVGDILGKRVPQMKRFAFKKPPLQVQVHTDRKEEAIALHRALARLAAEDPFLQYTQDAATGDHFIRIFGHVQQEVLLSALKNEQGLSVSMSEPLVVCIEKPSGVGAAVEWIGEKGNPFYATLGFRVEPGPEGSGLSYQLEAELGSLPPAFQRAVRDTCRVVLQEGLKGWAVEDIIVTLTHTGYWSPVSTARDFRGLAPLVLMEALRQAGTSVYEPLERIEVIVPERFLSTLLSRIVQLGGNVLEPAFHQAGVLIKGTIPVRTATRLKSSIHALSGGEGILISKPGGYERVAGKAPTKERRQLNPLERTNYLMRFSHTM